MITITNPETGTRHRIDKDAAQEISDALHRSNRGSEIVFRAMRMDRAVAQTIVNSCGFELTTPTDDASLGDMVSEDEKVTAIKSSGGETVAMDNAMTDPEANR